MRLAGASPRPTDTAAASVRRIWNPPLRGSACRMAALPPLSLWYARDSPRASRRLQRMYGEGRASVDDWPLPSGGGGCVRRRAGACSRRGVFAPYRGTSKSAILPYPTVAPVCGCARLRGVVGRRAGACSRRGVFAPYLGTSKSAILPYPTGLCAVRGGCARLRGVVGRRAGACSRRTSGLTLPYCSRLNTFCGALFACASMAVAACERILFFV